MQQGYSELPDIEEVALEECTEKELKKTQIDLMNDPAMLKEIVHQYLEESRKRRERWGVKMG